MKARDASELVYAKTSSHPVTDSLLFTAYSLGAAYATGFTVRYRQGFGYTVEEH